MSNIKISKDSDIEVKELEKIFWEKIYSSEEIDKILYIRDLFAKVGIYIEDFDKFEQIIKGLEMYEEMKDV